MASLTTLSYATLSSVASLPKALQLEQKWSLIPWMPDGYVWSLLLLCQLYCILWESSYSSSHIWCLVLISRLPSISSSFVSSCLVVSALSNHSLLWTYCLWWAIEHFAFFFIFKVLFLSNQSSAALSLKPLMSFCGVPALSQMLAFIITMPYSNSRITRKNDA